MIGGFRHRSLSALLVVLLVAAPAVVRAAVGVPACSEAQRQGVRIPRKEADAHRRFETPLIDIAPDETAGYPYFHEYAVRVDETGRVVCHLLEERDTPETRRHHADALAWQRRVARWHYEPFKRNGRAVPAIVAQDYYLQRRLRRHVAMPEVPLEQFDATLAHAGACGGCPGYALHVRGDGWVGYTGIRNVDVLGTHAWHVPAPDVAWLVAVIRELQVWSADDRYGVRDDKRWSARLALRFGNAHKTILEKDGRGAAMPMGVSWVESVVEQVARVKRWTVLSDDALDQLQREGFDFRSRAAGELLARAVDNHAARDDRPMLRLLQLGAPVDTQGDGGRVLLLAALRNRHVRLVEPLIAAGALATGGKPDPAKVDAAFQAGIAAGRLAPLQAIWNAAGPRRPSLDYVDDFGKRSPVVLRLERGWEDDAWEGLAIARWLEEQGNDLTAISGSDFSLLLRAVSADDARFVEYLLARGLDPQDVEGYVVGNARVEETALALLSAPGGAPRSGELWAKYRTQAVEKGWERVVAWLDAHRRIAKR
jgi:hypothetical protein